MRWGTTYATGIAASIRVVSFTVAVRALGMPRAGELRFNPTSAIPDCSALRHGEAGPLCRAARCLRR